MNTAYNKYKSHLKRKPPSWMPCAVAAVALLGLLLLLGASGASTDGVLHGHGIGTVKVGFRLISLRVHHPIIHVLVKIADFSTIMSSYTSAFAYVLVGCKTRNHDYIDDHNLLCV